jgi:hypothetical protein
METVYTMDEFNQETGAFRWDEKKFSGNAGGNPDPDSRRGFGPTEQYWYIPTEGGWTVWYGDNGGDIQAATAPDGTHYVRSHRMATDRLPGPDEAVKTQVVMRPESKRTKTMVVEYQSGYYAGSISTFDLFFSDEEQAAVAYITAAGMKYRFE